MRAAFVLRSGKTAIIMRIIQFWAAVLLAAPLCGCVTEASRQASRTASISSNNEYKIIVVPVPIYLSNPDRGDQDENSGEALPPERPDRAVHVRSFHLSEPTSIHENQQQNSEL